MKLYGYADEGKDPETITPRALAEITLCATPEELNLLSQFLKECAHEMLRMGSSYDHVHLSDRHEAFGSSPHFVVAAPENE